MTNPPQIPIENIYYLFCYAWNRFEEAQAVSVGAEACPDLPNLLAKVLLNSSRLLLKRGLDREYRRHSEAIATVRGHIDISSSLRLRAKRARQLHCEFDELTADVPHNQILKASLLRIARAPTIDRQLAHDLRSASQRFVGVGDIELRASTFSRIRLHRNNAHYELALRICELAFESLIPAPDGVGFTFQNVLRDERKMARVFEEFIRNFYRLEQRQFIVRPLVMKWPAIPVHITSKLTLPRMITDIFLASPDRSIIIDTKYYADMRSVFFGNETYRPDNIYQLFSYMSVANSLSLCHGPLEGILIYPQNGISAADTYIVNSMKLTIATVDLSQDWLKVAKTLLDLISFPSPNSSRSRIE